MARIEIIVRAVRDEAEGEKRGELLALAEERRHQRTGLLAALFELGVPGAGEEV